MLLLCGTKARNNSFPLEFELLETGNKDRKTFGKEKHGLSTLPERMARKTDFHPLIAEFLEKIIQSVNFFLGIAKNY
jgi:hypothetical protein